ncbi:sarcosine oxidase subunit delta [Labrys sp. LIt4]|uniref:Sarcosine oxidase subunit delta n=1 Tax=Labrys okinawensis TaxID=346911 RepID=A0A2S9QD12_9HYPH|nr:MULTISPECIES: sarcosine oxidase subunit delta [Labrys]MBP0582052.1 sarcosine oxidase subunit delta [Labrys sp. LIt4]PRH87237.1 sarcosine oxidase subunit delta [Labrys okinawensis]
MRIACPYCGARGVHEFTYLGDAGPSRPDASAPDAGKQFYEYAYLRDNPEGAHEEFWYHGSGCRSWLKVRRNTKTHAIEKAELVMPQTSGAAS